MTSRKEPTDFPKHSPPSEPRLLLEASETDCRKMRQLPLPPTIFLTRSRSIGVSPVQNTIQNPRGMKEGSRGCSAARIPGSHLLQILVERATAEFASFPEDLSLTASRKEAVEPLFCFRIRDRRCLFRFDTLRSNTQSQLRITPNKRLRMTGV